MSITIIITRKYKLKLTFMYNQKVDPIIYDILPLKKINTINLL